MVDCLPLLPGVQVAVDWEMHGGASASSCSDFSQVLSRHRTVNHIDLCNLLLLDPIASVQLNSRWPVKKKANMQ